MAWIDPFALAPFHFDTSHATILVFVVFGFWWREPCQISFCVWLETGEETLTDRLPCVFGEGMVSFYGKVMVVFEIFRVRQHHPIVARPTISELDRLLIVDNRNHDARRRVSVQHITVRLQHSFVDQSFNGWKSDRFFFHFQTVITGRRPRVPSGLKPSCMPSFKPRCHFVLFN